MASTYSDNLRLELIGTGDQAGNWGDTTNRNLGTLLESAISGAVTVTTTTTNQALTIANGSADQARNMVLKLNTTSGGAYNVYAPPYPKVYVVRNLSGTYAAQLFNSTVSGNTTAAGTGVTIPANKSLVVFSDGTDMLGVSVTTNANLTGVVTSVGNATSFGSSTGSGAVVLATSPTLVTPTLVTPALGTPSTLVGTNITGTATNFTASNVTTNADLTGVVTSVGNATSFGSFTGSGAVVLATSPTLVTPALGTPSTLVGTNITGTATNFTASNVTTNANLTGVVTSVGNATSFGSSTGSGAVVLATSPTLVTSTVGLVTYTETVYAVTGTTPALSPNNGTIQTWTLSGASTPTAGTWADGQSLTLMVNAGATYTITWSALAVSWKTNFGVAPTLNTSGATAIQLWKVGSTIYGARVGDA